MEGLRLIAQSTFDRHQRFRPAPSGPAPGEEGGEGGPYRYNVVEIGAFPGWTTAPAAASSSSSRPTGGKPDGGGGGPSRVTLNEWMVHEDDLGAFMRKRPVHVVSNPTTIPPPAAAAAAAAAASTTGPSSRSASSKGAGSSGASMTTTASATTTATTATGMTSAGTRRAGGAGAREEIEAVASLKLVCIQRAAPDDADADDSNALAISRDVFLRLYVDLMGADHCALYHLARGYDGFHEFGDGGAVATKFLGTSDYALVWTFNRRTLETRGLFVDRRQAWQQQQPASAPGDDRDGGAPATPGSARWISRDGAGAVAAGEGWQVFRETLRVYRTYVFAPQLLTFVGCVHMLRAFDDQVAADDLPLLRGAEAGVAADERGAVGAGSFLLPTQTSGGFVIAPEQQLQTPTPFAPSTPPSEAEKTTRRQTADRRGTRLSRALAAGASLSDKLRHLGTARTALGALAREHETVVADVVAPAFLDRYHRSMEGMTEAVPALERHLASLEEYLRYLKGRSERLGGALVPCPDVPSGWASRSRPSREPSARWSIDLAPAGGRREQSGGASPERLTAAVVTLASMPAIFFAGIIAIVSVRWSFTIPCLVLVFYYWVTVTHREFLVEVLGDETSAGLDTPGLEDGRRKDHRAVLV